MDTRWPARGSLSVTGLGVLLGMLAGLLPAAVSHGQTPTNRDQSRHTDLKEEGYPIRSGLRSVPAREATLQDSDIVIGVVAGGEARAYPVNPMWEPANEVLNDTLGGEPVTVTWCPVAHTGTAFDPRVDGTRLELGAVGLQNGVSILYDRETGSRWSQIVGRAVQGPLEDRELRQWPSVLTTWGRWRQLHPKTTVMADPSLSGLRQFTAETWGWMLAFAEEGPVVNEDLVAGVVARGSARAWLLRSVEKAGRVVNDTVDGEPVVVFLGTDEVTVRALRRTPGGRVLTFEARGDLLRDEETGSEWDPMTGRALSGPLAGATLEPVPVTTALWYAWHSQRPDTSLWETP